MHDLSGRVFNLKDKKKLFKIFLKIDDVCRVVLEQFFLQIQDFLSRKTILKISLQIHDVCLKTLEGFCLKIPDFQNILKQTRILGK